MTPYLVENTASDNLTEKLVERKVAKKPVESPTTELGKNDSSMNSEFVDETLDEFQRVSLSVKNQERVEVLKRKQAEEVRCAFSSMNCCPSLFSSFTIFKQPTAL